MSAEVLDARLESFQDFHPVVMPRDKLLAAQMSEQDITQVAAFFNSPAGKKYVQATPIFLQNLGDVTGAWREKLSTDILERARAEMKKKGVEF